IGATSIPGVAGITKDLLVLKTKSLFLPYNRLLGVVSENYFAYHGHSDWDGVSQFKASLVSNDRDNIQVVAHELAHSFGVDWEEYTEGGDYDGSPVRGYDATSGKGFIYDPQANRAEQIWSLMGPTRILNNSSVLDEYWIDNRTYNRIFSF